MAQNVARLGVILGIDVAEFTKGLNEAKSKLKEFASLAADVAVAGIAAMTYKALEFSNAMSDLSDATGVGIAKILQISDALEMSGGHAEDAGKVLVKFSDNIDKAAQGSKPLQDAFARVGVSLQDLSKLSTEQLLQKSTDGMSKLADKASQTGASLALLGKGFRGTDVEGFNRLIQEGTKEFDKFADAVANAADLHDKLAKKATITGLIFTEKVLPVLNQIFETINAKGGMAEDVFELLRKGLMGLWGAGVIVAKSFEYVGIVKDKVFGNINTSEMEAKLKKLDDDSKAFVEKWRKIDAGVYDVKAKPGEAGGNRPVTPGKDPAAVRMEQMLAVSKLVSIEYQRQMSTLLQQQAIKNLMAGMTTDEARVQGAVNQVLDTTSKKLDEIAKKKEEAVAHSAGTKEDIKKVTDELDRQAEEVSRLGDIFADMARKNEEYAIKSQRTFEFGWSKAFNQFREDAYNNAKIAEDMFASVTNSMNSAIDTFVTTGKLSFADLAKSVLQDLEKIILKALLMRSITSMGSLMGAEGGIASLIGGFFADGGSPPVGVPSVVGEKGPELFIPRQAGTIIPNSQIANAMGGGGQTINYNAPYINSMSAIDTQSAMQFLSQNKMGIWASYQSAAKSLPMSR
ncbi:MAG: phage tail tape measure C-terminal domain-containing protein [Bacteroidota bacterium]